MSLSCQCSNYYHEQHIQQQQHQNHFPLSQQLQENVNLNVNINVLPSVQHQNGDTSHEQYFYCHYGQGHHHPYYQQYQEHLSNLQLTPPHIPESYYGHFYEPSAHHLHQQLPNKTVETPWSSPDLSVIYPPIPHHSYTNLTPGETLPSLKQPPSELPTSTRARKKSKKSGAQSMKPKKKAIFSCPIDGCIKTFLCMSNLEAHKRNHRGEKPFKCSWKDCSWRFTRCYELSRHMRKHTEDRPYQCRMCERAFFRSDHLSLHMKRHWKAQGANRENNESLCRISESNQHPTGN